ncbi:MAG: GtrA family protein [Bacillota bacterium]|nr:GtrA family protein [Bacillota bacterium]
MKPNFQAWKAKHAGLWQFVMFTLMSMITTVVDLGSFALFHFLVFAGLRDRPFAWWIIAYGVDDGGLGAFLAFALSFAISQTFNFFLQRKTTFKADNNVLWSGIMYAVMVIAVYLLQILVPSWILAPIAGVFGIAFGAILVKFINMTLSMLIQFPMNKYIIMRASIRKPATTDGAESPRE